MLSKARLKRVGSGLVWGLLAWGSSPVWHTSTRLRLQALVRVRPNRRHDDRRRPCLRARLHTGGAASRDMPQHIQAKPLHDQLAWLESV